MFNSFDIEGSGSSSLSGKQMIQQSNTGVKDGKELPVLTANADAPAAVDSVPVCSNGVCMVTWKPRKA